ncbi:MAG: tetratricopeptide repeat protein [Smithellaceae bacterium]|jgi:predicted negative regulator of RcsB-dependent stress response
MSAKLSKKQLKGPDIFQSSFEKITDYISENTVRFFAIATTVILTVVIAFGIYLYWSNYQTTAAQIYAKAQASVIRSEVDPEAVPESMKIFQELIDKYPHSWSARMAYYHLGNIYYNSGDLDNAINSYKKFVSSTKSDDAGIKFLALTSLGYCFEAKKDFKSALNYFEEAQKSNNTGFEAIGYRNIARIYEELNDKKKALENYQNALVKTADPSMVLFIKRKISSLS